MLQQRVLDELTHEMVTMNICQHQTTFVEVGTTALIQSPNYPDNYPANLNCSWTISTIRNDERVRLIFLSLNIDTRGDRLILLDGDDVMTGPLDPIHLDNNDLLEPAGLKRPYFSSAKLMTITLVTNSKFEASGFQVQATAVKRGDDEKARENSNVLDFSFQDILALMNTHWYI